MKLKLLDKIIGEHLLSYGLPVLRYSLVLIFIWFGLLKSFGVSSANELVTQTIYWFDPSWFVPFLGWWEVVIGICFLWKPLIRIGLPLMALQMAGTFLPLLLLPHITFISFPFVLSLEGQYIVKNLVLIGAAMVVGGLLYKK